MRPALYFPILRAKPGEIDGLTHLSPRTKMRVRPVLDVPAYFEDPKKALEEHFTQITRAVAAGWGTALPFHFDLLRYGPEVRAADGRTAAEYLFHCARQLRLRAIPVAGPESERGPGRDYIDAVSRIARHDGRGAAIRFPYDDLAEPDSILEKADELISALQLKAEDIDIFLDTEALSVMPPANASEQSVLLTFDEALWRFDKRPFRNIAIAASSVPEHLTARDDGAPIVVPRTELRIWKRLLDSGRRRIVHFSDYAVIFPKQSDPKGPVIPPARIRLTTPEHQHFFRADRTDYRELCSQVMKTAEFCELPAAWGVDAIRESGAGGGGQGGPTAWVARDTNIHIEVTVATLEKHLAAAGRLGEFEFEVAQATPWSQSSLLSSA